MELTPQLAFSTVLLFFLTIIFFCKKKENVFYIQAYEMEEMEQHNSISLGNKVMDTLLHGGLLSGSLTEFVGEWQHWS